MVFECSLSASDSGQEIRAYKDMARLNTVQSLNHDILNSKVESQTNDIYFLSDASSENIYEYFFEKMPDGFNLTRRDIENKDLIIVGISIGSAIIILIIFFLLCWCVSQLRLTNRLGRSMAFSSINAARSSNRAAIAAKWIYENNINSNALQLRPYLKLESPAFRFVNSDGRFYMVLTMVVSNYGSTPAKNFAGIETKRVQITTISSSGEEKGHATLDTDPNNATRNDGFNVRYIGPDAKAKVFVSTCLAIESESKDIFEILASSKPGKWRVHRIYFIGILRFKDDYRISANEHYELKFRFLTGFGDETNIRIESERIVSDDEN